MKNDRLVGYYTEIGMPNFRWLKSGNSLRLQHMVEIREYLGHAHVGSEMEWRDVPIVEEKT